MPTFRYFAEPHAYSTYTFEPEACESCGRRLPGFRGPFYGTREINFVCENCLASGALALLDQQTNDPDVAGLRQQVATLRSDLSESEQEHIVVGRTEELVYRTPPLVTWQDLMWPAHCGDYCRFLKEAGKPDLERWAAPQEGKAFLATHLHEKLDIDLDYLWDCIRPDSPQDGRVAYDVGIWLFQCPTCAARVLLWDAS